MTTTDDRGFRLSPLQRRLWTLQQESRAYRTGGVVELTGAVDPERLRSALATVVGRHDLLRSRFQRSPGIRYPVQVVGHEGDFLWRFQDLAAGADDDHRRAVERFDRPFDLERGPLLAALLLERAPERFELHLAAPSLVLDRRGLELLVEETIAAYGADAADGQGAAEEPPVQYAEVAAWHNELAEGDDGRAGREHWAERDLGSVFEGGPAERTVFAPETVAVPLDGSTADALRQLAGRLDRSLEVVLLTAWQGLALRLAGGGSVGVGVLTDARHHEGLEGVPGLLSRLVPVAPALDLDESWERGIGRIAEELEEARELADFFLADVYADPGGRPAVWPLAFELVPPASLGDADGVAFGWSEGGGQAVVDRANATLVATVAGHGDGELDLALRIDGSVIDRLQAEQLAERLGRLLEGLAEDPSSALRRTPLMGDEEKHQLLSLLDATAEAEPGPGLARRFEQQADRTPDAVAVERGEDRLTYAELDRRSSQLARALRAAGVGPETVVGVTLGRHPEMVVALLAIVRAGGAYLPLDLADPVERLAFMAHDARVRLLITESAAVETADALLARTAELGDGRAVERWLMDAEWDQRIAGQSAERPEPVDAADSLVYVLYTSGSTGAPKGVMVRSAGLDAYLAWAVATYRPDRAPTPVHSPLGFDLTVTSLWAPLVAGGRLVLVSDERGVEGLAQVLLGAGREIGVVKLTPSHLAVLGQTLEHQRMVLHEDGFDALAGGSIDCLVLGGEALTGEVLAPWREQVPSLRIVNEYGPTETVVGCAAHEVPPGKPAAGPVPIGRPIAGAHLLVLDPWGEPVPAGATGELWVGGAGVSRGYLARPATTAEAFVPDAFGDQPGARLYRTGDRVRLLADAELVFLGRIDAQVKVRGFRLELGEVEAVLGEHPGVTEPVVITREDRPGDVRLVAYYVRRQEVEGPKVEELRRFLAERLPDHMVPAFFVALNLMPLTDRGKVDRAALPVPSSARPDLEHEYVAPRTELETTLAEIWATALGVERVGVHDSFFALGGDSIRSVRVVALLQERGIETTVEEMFRRQTVEELARHLESEADGAADAAELTALLAEVESMSEQEAQARLAGEPTASDGGDEG